MAIKNTGGIVLSKRVTDGGWPKQSPMSFDTVRQRGGVAYCRYAEPQYAFLKPVRYDREALTPHHNSFSKVNIRGAHHRSALPTLCGPLLCPPYRMPVLGPSGFHFRGGMGWDGSVSNTCQTRRQADPMCQRLVPQAAARWTRSHANHH